MRYSARSLFSTGECERERSKTASLERVSHTVNIGAVAWNRRGKNVRIRRAVSDITVND